MPRWLTQRGFCGVPERTRTSDLWFRKPTLYPLSYGYMRQRDVPAGDEGMLLHETA